jgi:hypothetical protein
MTRGLRIALLGLLLTGLLVQAQAPAAARKTPREGLQALHDLIGPWRGTGEPWGTREEKLRGFWVEKIDWQWQFKGPDVFLLGTVDKGKHLARAEIRYAPERDVYVFKATRADKAVVTFEGKLAGKKLILDRVDEKTRQGQRLTFSLLHSDRHLYRYEVRAPESMLYSTLFQVGATRLGVDFASGDGRPECIVSGGLGTMPVMYRGKTYHVCCSGCRDEFNENPVKYITEFEAKKKAKKKD